MNKSIIERAKSYQTTGDLTNKDLDFVEAFVEELERILGVLVRRDEQLVTEVNKKWAAEKENDLLSVSLGREAKAASDLRIENAELMQESEALTNAVHEVASLKARLEKYEHVLLDCHKYLDRNDGVANYIGTESILHRHIKDALEPAPSQQDGLPLAEMLKDAKTVYATRLFSQRKAGTLPLIWDRRGPQDLHTHCAKLICIEELKK